MSNRIIEIIVEKDGSTRVQTKGFSGSSCVEASRFIEEALGKRMSEQTTPEFFESVQQRNRLREGGG